MEYQDWIMRIEGEASRAPIGYHLRWDDPEGNDRWAQGEFAFGEDENGRKIIIHDVFDDEESNHPSYIVTGRI